LFRGQIPAAAMPKVAFGLVGQIVFWNDKENFGFIRTREMSDSDDSYKCYGSAFVNRCGKKDIVKFDVWENYQTEKKKAVNVRFHQPATRAADIRNATDILHVPRHVHLAGVDGWVVTLSHSCGFVSTKLFDNDIYFNSTELTRVRMQEIRHRDRITFDVIMEEDGKLTAENINLHTDLVKIRQLVAEANQVVADFEAHKCGDKKAEVPTVSVCEAGKKVPAVDNVNTVKKVPAVDDTIKKVPALDDDCASTAASDLPEATPEPNSSEVRKLQKKLREIRVLEGRHDLDQLQQSKVANKFEYERRLERLTA